MKAPQLPQKGNLFVQALQGKLSFDELSAQQDANTPLGPLHTGRYFVLFDEKEADFKNFKNLLHEKVGMQTASLGDFKAESFNQSKIQSADALIYDNYRIALIGGEKEQMALVKNLNFKGRLVPEKIVSIPEDRPSLLPYDIAQKFTWGIESIQALASQYEGKGVKIAVLDTGIDAAHPHFKNRTIISQSFVPGESPQDGQGHGTHCIGTAGGGKNDKGVRYGVASESELYSFKVLSNRGCGAQSWILEGLEAADQQEVDVVSLSLGSDVSVGEAYDPIYERAFNRIKAIAVVAAGNESRRSRGLISPVGSPANCPSVLAIGAIDIHMKIAEFSCGSINENQSVALSAPGVNVYSSWPTALGDGSGTKTISGTSMATPHVAGVVAQYIEAYPEASKEEIKKKLLQSAKKLSLPKSDMGAGLVQSPV
ncbi:MAG: S8 family serine peptidase [Bacteroidota bacterium]